MTEFTLKLAGKHIAISALFETTKKFCEDYLTDEAAEFSVSVSPEDVAFERGKSAREDEAEGIPVRHFSDEYLETLAVYRKIAEKMPEYDTVLFHGSVVAVDGMGYLFTAGSGTGKSTHTRLWRETFGVRAFMVNDDKPLLQITENGVLAHGTPWDGKHRLSRNSSVPLKAICILERGETNKIEKITKKEAYSMLMQQIYRPADMGSMMKTLALLDRLANSAGLFRLHCNMEPEAAQVAYNGMNERI